MTMTWLVRVNLTGVMPIRVPKKMKVNRVKTNGTCRRPASPAALTTVSDTNS
jgi:hypothetical protein